MSSLQVPSKFIDFDDRDRPILAGTTTKVMEIVLDHVAYGWSADEIYFQHSRQFPLAQIYAALSYYYENRAEFDAEIDRDDREFDALRRAEGETPFVRRKRAESRFP